MALTFRAFINQVPATSTPQDDFIALAKEHAWLSGASSWPELRDYLKASRTSRPAIKVALDVWKAYEAARDRHA
jgi:hypothetical protein